MHSYKFTLKHEHTFGNWNGCFGLACRASKISDVVMGSGMIVACFGVTDLGPESHEIPLNHHQTP
jgi:hypothetical protein